MLTISAGAEDRVSPPNGELNAAGSIIAAEDSGLGSLAVHEHTPIRVHSRPVIERLAVNVIEPVDLRVSESGRIFIADARARTVFRIQSDGRVDLAAKDMDGLLRIHVDGDDNLFVLTASAGSGRIFQVTPAGYSVELHAVGFRPAGFARDQTGRFIVVSAVGGQTIAIDSDGRLQELAHLSERCVDIELSSSDQPHVLLPSGKIVLLGLDETSETVGFAPENSQRLLRLPEGRLAALHSEAGSRPVIRTVSDTQGDAASVFAQVPFGTSAASFDKSGNLCLANPDLRAVTKITSHFVVPCPHCGRSLKMVFSTDDSEEPAEVIKRSF